MNVLFFVGLVTAFLTQPVLGVDCQNIKPFVAFEYQAVTITVERSFWVNEKGVQVRKVEPVCHTKQPQNVGVYDIRGREDEWFYCFYQEPRPVLECQTTFQNKPAGLIVRPAVVLRTKESPVRDTHAHIFLLPENDATRYHDTLVRSRSPNLEKTPILLDSSSGGVGESAGQDSYYVGLNFN